MINRHIFVFIFLFSWGFEGFNEVDLKFEYCREKKVKLTEGGGFSWAGVGFIQTSCEVDRNS